MDFDYLNATIKDYINNVSEKSPVPGGGSVTALSAVLSSSLINMVLNYTLGKEKYARYEKELNEIKEENRVILANLSGFVEEDSRIYSAMRKYRKKSPAVCNEYMEKSVYLHEKICFYMIEVLGFAGFLAEKGNKALISDSFIAAELAFSSLQSARINILINLKYMKDRDFVKDYKEKIKSFESRGKRKLKEINSSGVNL